MTAQTRLAPAPILWFTGVPSAAAALATAVTDHLRRSGAAAEHIDSLVQAVVPADAGAACEAGLHLAVLLANRLSLQGVTALCALEIPPSCPHAFPRGRCERYAEVFLADLDDRPSTALAAADDLGEDGLDCFDSARRLPRSPELWLNPSELSPSSALHAVMNVWAATSVRRLAVVLPKAVAPRRCAEAGGDRDAASELRTPRWPLGSPGVVPDRRVVPWRTGRRVQAGAPSR